jgi:hypothetical protein
MQIQLLSPTIIVPILIIAQSLVPSVVAARGVTIPRVPHLPKVKSLPRLPRFSTSHPLKPYNSGRKKNIFRLHRSEHSSENADDYYNGGISKSNSGDRKGAIADLTKAANLYRKQHRYDKYRQTMQSIEKLRYKTQN